ncbi:glycoside hydrolase superfamily [Cantharellus anzutake]|uniref:glycoside hydrolase superfamily n=1 Tax=Cantharellus anzutake TaxID=1750568 RepID=UPI0019073A0B|nr:glycoside hydrolase superfamily [Cantharellus anzutake]KAF8323506.1 glycoside hydrolase superfamily [Cantharellus anzutake]
MRPSTILLALVFPSSILATNHFSGLAVSNSVGGTGSYTCRTQAQWNQLASDARNNGFAAVRIEGFDCDALDMVSSAAAAVGIEVLVGIYVSGTIADGMIGINNDVQTFLAAYRKYGAGLYVGLTIGNEVNDSAGNIMAKVYDVRGYLRSVGVTTPVSSVHIWAFIRDNPEMCGADFGAANAHAFYDPPSTSADAGSFILNTVVPAVKTACGSNSFIIAESGWPSRGSPVGAGIPSLDDEMTALKNLNCAASTASIYAFEYDDQLWKGTEADQSFGIFGKINFGADFSAC